MESFFLDKKPLLYTNNKVTLFLIALLISNYKFFFEVILYTQFVRLFQRETTSVTSHLLPCVENPLLHLEQPKLKRVLAVLKVIELKD